LLNEDDLNIENKSIVNRFIMHQAWISVDLVQTVTGCLSWQRLEARMLEMKDRRRQLAKAIAKQEGHEEQFDKMYDEIINSKTLVMQMYT
jgi:hypothetical protein